MKLRFQKKFEKNLSKIVDHTAKSFSADKAAEVYSAIKSSVLKLEKFPKLGHPVAGNQLRRKLIIAGNLVLYEIRLGTEPMIIVLTIVPRKTR